MLIQDFKCRLGIWQKSAGKHAITVSGRRWYAMQDRCKRNGRYQSIAPTYKGCSISNEFENFHGFTEWHRGAIGYNLHGYALDKDVLVEGNKVYSPYTCVLIPRELNNFLCSNVANRGEYPQGLSFNSAQSKIQVHISIDGRSVNLGSYTDIESAKYAYKLAKESEARQWAYRLKCGEFQVDQRVITSLENWIFNDAK